MDIVQHTLLEQYKRKKPETFMGENLSKFDNVIAALANDDMFTHFCISFESDRLLPLQTQLLCSMANVLTLPDAKEWYGRFDQPEQRHIPFNILTLCHQFKVRFVVALK